MTLRTVPSQRALAQTMAALATLTFACSAGLPVESVASGSAYESTAVVAEIDGEPITLEELDRAIASELYDLRSEGLEQLIEERALTSEADRRGVEVAALVAEETAKLEPVTDEEIARFYAQNESRIPAGRTLETIAPQIRDVLEEARAREAVGLLLERVEVAVFLTPPRIDVEALGPALGPADAPVTIVAWSDYQCPYCARAEPVLRELLALYPTQVRLVFRHMPLSFHSQARPAAIAAVCAEEQGRFWDYHDGLFAQPGKLSPDAFGSLADEVGLDRSAFDSCTVSAAASARVERDIRDAEASGATGTPAFNVNGIQFSGARPLEAFIELVEQELALADRAHDG